MCQHYQDDSAKSIFGAVVGFALSIVLIAVAGIRTISAAEESGDVSTTTQSQEEASLEELLVPQTVPPAAPAQVAQGLSSVPATLSLERGDIRSMPVRGVTRVAIGNPTSWMSPLSR
mgnify:CR=1 FL=1